MLDTEAVLLFVAYRERENDMSDEIFTGSIDVFRAESSPVRRLIPMQVGKATVYVEQIGESAEVQTDDSIYPVAPPTPREAFENAVDVLQECVRVVGTKIETLAAKTMPQEVTVEFSLTFQARGKLALVPVLVTGESGLETGLKVTALWKRSEEEA